MLTTTDLVRGNNAYFVATGVTDGEVLRGVRFAQDLADHPVAVHAIEQRRGPHHRDQAPAQYLDPGPVDPELAPGARRDDRNRHRRPPEPSRTRRPKITAPPSRFRSWLLEGLIDKKGSHPGPDKVAGRPRTSRTPGGR